MADNSSILSDFGINILEEEIDDVIFQTNEFLCDATFTGSNGPFWWLLVVAVTNSPKHDLNRCKSVIYKFLSRDQKSARDKNGTKPRKNKVKNTLPEISLVEYLCFVCKGTNLALEKRGEIPISLIHNSFSYHCTPNVVIANGFDLKQHGLRKSCVKLCFALCWTFSKTRTGNRTKDLPPLCKRIRDAALSIFFYLFTFAA